MNDGKRIALHFPEIQWQGRSKIHRSVSAMVEYPGHMSNRQVVHDLVHGKMIPHQMYCLKKFTGMTWTLTPVEIASLVIRDWFLLLANKGPSTSKNQLKNPITESMFHQVAKKDHIIGGIRSFMERLGGDVFVGWRFRLVIDPNITQAQLSGTMKVEMESVVEIQSELADFLAQAEEQQQTEDETPERQRQRE